MAEGCRLLLPRGARGTHAQDLHLTLRFLGPLSPAALGSVEGAAESVAGLSPVPLCIDRLGHFPRSGILWGGPAVPGQGLLGLVARLEEALSARGFVPEERSFRAHITLARKVWRPPPMTWAAPIPWIARELVLAAGQEGAVPRYRVRRSWALTGPLDPPLDRRLPCAEAFRGPGSASSQV